MKSAELQDVAEVCGVLANPIRLSIMVILSKGAQPVKVFRRELKLAHPLASYHLMLLRMSGLVDRKRTGKAQIYSLNRERLAPVRAFLAKLK